MKVVSEGKTSSHLSALSRTRVLDPSKINGPDIAVSVQAFTTRNLRLLETSVGLLFKTKCRPLDVLRVAKLVHMQDKANSSI